jgi:hypothetical protein
MSLDFVCGMFIVTYTHTNILDLTGPNFSAFRIFNGNTKTDIKLQLFEEYYVWTKEKRNNTDKMLVTRP